MLRKVLPSALAVALTVILGGQSAQAQVSSDQASAGKLAVTPAVLTTNADRASVPITEVQWRRGYYRPYSNRSYRPYRSYSYYPNYSYGYGSYPYYSYGYYPYGYSYYRPYYSGYYYPRYYTGYRGFSYYGPSFYGSFYW